MTRCVRGLAFVLIELLGLLAVETKANDRKKTPNHHRCGYRQRGRRLLACDGWTRREGCHRLNGIRDC